MAISPKHSRWIAELKQEGFDIIKPNYLKCRCCGKEKSIKENHFYLSASNLNKVDGLIPICKACLEAQYIKYLTDENGNEKYAMYKLCRWVDAVWAIGGWEGAKSSKSKIWKMYFQKINSLKQYKDLTFIDSDPLEKTIEEIKEEREIKSGKIKLTKDEKNARDDIIEAIGRDPYCDFSLIDQKKLYPELIEYLDEDTQENPFLVGQIIQITINNNTIQKLNEALSSITKDIMQLEQNQEKLKNMTNIIKALSDTTTKIAKENGIAKKGSDSKKRSTLTGMMAYYRDISLEDVEVDYYNQKVCYGMQRASDISIKSIFEQGLFKDNEFAEMLQTSRALVKDLELKVLDLEEKNRLLHVKISKIDNNKQDN